MNSFTKRPLPPSRQPKASFIESKELNLPSCRNFETYPLSLIFCLTPSDPPLPSPLRSRFGEARQGRGGGGIT